MAKPKEAKELEWFQGEIRKLRSENKALRKRLKSLEKNRHIYQELKLDKEIDEEIESEAKPQPYNICPQCSRKGLIEVVIVGRVFKKCEFCEFRTRATKIEAND